MKKIAITACNMRDRLNAELSAVQHACSARTISVDDIVSACGELEEMLSVPKNALKDVCVHIDINAQDFPSAYKYDPLSTHVYLEHNGKCWCVYNLTRERCTRKYIFIAHTATSKEAIIKRFTEVRR